MFGTENPIGRKGSGETTPELMRDPNLDPTTEPPEPLWRHDNYGADNEDSPRINATLLSLVRNNELDAMVETMKQLERKFNHKFNYPWIFFNNEPFSDDFKEKTKEQTKAKVRYELIPKEHWEVPSWIQNDLLLESADILANKKVQYARMLSYHQMCRWNSGMFYKHPALEHTRYYWRVEPKVKFFCDIDYDVFRYMQDHNKTYGFTINLYEDPNSIPTLWPETEKFMAEHPEFIHENSAMDWLTDSKRQEHHEKSHGYSTCHFWSNFEIADMDFWRSPAYEAYFNHLDRAGGFFYERWGDAPVHSIALGLFEDKSSEILVINIYPSSTAPTHPNARTAAQASSRTVKAGSIRKIADPTGSNT
ncbi:MAG: hypothetical protein M1829_000219 [Trizodia sp. TS-e1964]|nr:MAG: hypothetical protein M1829_000219 [Trizodia sp. TS-e1964]